MISMQVDENCIPVKKRAGLLLRITPKEDFSASSTGTNRKFISAADVMDLHFRILEENPADGVWFSHSQTRLKEEIERLIVFHWKADQNFVIELFFDSYIQESEPFIPAKISSGTGRTPSQWRDIPEKCWVHVTGYKVLTPSDISSIHMLRSGDTMDKQIEKAGFRAAKFKL